MKKSLFGGLFDFDDDGELDVVEKAAELLYLESFDEDNEEDHGSSAIGGAYYDSIGSSRHRN